MCDLDRTDCQANTRQSAPGVKGARNLELFFYEFMFVKPPVNYLIIKLDEDHVFVGSVVLDYLHAFDPFFISCYELEEISGCHAGRYSQHADHLTPARLLIQRRLLTEVNQVHYFFMFFISL